jgi:L,D-peptidoglycan transpeptidase YkuD (ErfK/YbiS/YcfS/YnhG family)
VYVYSNTSTRTTAASRRGYGSGASARSLYTLRNAFSDTFERLVKLSISLKIPNSNHLWCQSSIRRTNNVTFDMLFECEHTELWRKGSLMHVPLSNVLKAPAFSSSGIFLNSDGMDAMVSLP